MGKSGKASSDWGQLGTNVIKLAGSMPRVQARRSATARVLVACDALYCFVVMLRQLHTSVFNVDYADSDSLANLEKHVSA